LSLIIGVILSTICVLLCSGAFCSSDWALTLSNNVWSNQECVTHNTDPMVDTADGLEWCGLHYERVWVVSVL